MSKRRVRITKGATAVIYRQDDIAVKKIKYDSDGTGSRTSYFRSEHVDPIISKILHDALSEEIPHIVPFVSFDVEKLELYMKYANKGSLYHYPKSKMNDSTFLYYYFQIVWSLYVIQKKFRAFRHNDFNVTNILLNRHIVPIDLSYSDPDHEIAFALPNADNNCVIWISDFDAASISGIIENYKVLDIQINLPTYSYGSGVNHVADLFKITYNMYVLWKNRLSETLQNYLEHIFKGTLNVNLSENHNCPTFDILSKGLPTPKQLIFDSILFNSYRIPFNGTTTKWNIDSSRMNFASPYEVTNEKRLVPFFMNPNQVQLSKVLFMNLRAARLHPTKPFNAPTFIRMLCAVELAPLSMKSKLTIYEKTVGDFSFIINAYRDVIPQNIDVLIVMCILCRVVTRTYNLPLGFELETPDVWCDRYAPMYTDRHFIQTLLQLNWILD